MFNLVPYLFRDRSRDVAMATNFRHQIGRNRRYAVLVGTRIPQQMARWQSGWTH